MERMEHMEPVEPVEPVESDAASGALTAAGLTAEAFSAEERAVLAALSAEELAVLAAIKRRLDEAEPEPDVVAHHMVGGLFF
ncbi:aroma-sacti cluster domain-containing protein [Streptomyces klenkii]|uniref:aroma-sacti cluster domain-containing protein n=1 Tax=Streptomyces klenkii TaxID=1420899 RepID=UPI0033BA71F6